MEVQSLGWTSDLVLIDAAVHSNLMILNPAREIVDFVHTLGSIEKGTAYRFLNADAATLY